MKVKQTTVSYDDECRHSVTIDADKRHLVFSDGEVEDNTLMRNFNDVFSIIDLMRLAHEAGVRGEPFEVEIVETEE